MKRTKHVEVVIAAAMARGVPDQPLVKFQVRDTRVGIPSQPLARLFQRVLLVDDSAATRRALAAQPYHSGVAPAARPECRWRYRDAARR